MREGYAVKHLVNCRAYAFDPLARTYAVRDALVLDGTRIVALGSEQTGGGLETIDLHGATVVPAFADCHVHLTDTGLTAGLADLSDVRSASAFATRIAALPPGPVVYAANYDDAAWPDGTANAGVLERAWPGRPAFVVRVDGHSSLANRAALARIALDPGLPGIERDGDGVPTGRLFFDANWTAQSRWFAALSEAERRAADRRAHALALAAGVVHLHAQLIGLESRDAYVAEIAALRALGPAKWHPKICERDPALAASLGLRYVGGDVFLDGSLGSRTAALSTPYCDREGSGRLALSDADVERFFAEAEALGISAGVHAIGDRAIEQCLAAWERVLRGVPSTRARHFIEHFEVATREQIARAARLGLYLSMQPQFDAAWGGPEGMYETRLGRERAHGMNALRTALAAGAVLCGGDDSPVCRLAPLAGMAAACAHHNADERLAPLEALTMYTYDAARLAHAERDTGALQPGFAADLVVLDRDPFAGAAFDDTTVRETWVDGLRAYVR